MKSAIVAIASLALLLATGPVLADDDAPDKTKAGQAIAKRFYIAPMGSYTFADGDRNTKNGVGGSLVIGKQIGRSFDLELTGQYAHFKGDDGGRDQVYGGGVDALVFPSITLSGLFGVAGVGYGQENSSVPSLPHSNGRSTLWNVGAGYLIGPIAFLNDGGIRIEARETADEKHVGGKNDFTEGKLSLGLLVPIGAAPTPPPPVAAPAEVVPAAAPADTDGDGVTDDKDHCPGTPPGIAVDAVGCPLPPPPPPCKTPEPGQKVDLSGCATGDTIVLRGVNFDFDKATLTANAKTILDSVADALMTVPSIQVEVGGHTDSKGSDSYNQKLSERRAQSVVNYLEGKGIAVDRMTAAGYGETEPVADNATDEGREQNRRVELKITGSSATANPSSETPPVSADSAHAAME